MSDFVESAIDKGKLLQLILNREEDIMGMSNHFIGADCQVTYYEDGSGRTEVRTRISRKEELDWFNVTRKSGGDYRFNFDLMGLIFETDDLVIRRWLKHENLNDNDSD